MMGDVTIVTAAALVAAGVAIGVWIAPVADDAPGRRASLRNPNGTVADVEDKAFEKSKKKHGLK